MISCLLLLCKKLEQNLTRCFIREFLILLVDFLLSLMVGYRGHLIQIRKRNDLYELSISKVVQW